MLLSDTLRTAVTAIAINRTRSVLTMLGIVIGVGSVVLMVSAGSSFQHYIVTEIETIGTNTMDVFPKGFEKFGGNLDSLTLDDFEQVKRLSTVERVTPVIIVSKPVEQGKDALSPMVIGAYATVIGNYGLTIDHGRLLEEADERGAQSVAVLAFQTAIDLFGSLDPVGRRITIGGVPFTVIGTTQSAGSALLSDLDKVVFIPFSTARSISGQTYLSYITLKTVGDPELAKQDITSILRQNHHIRNPENDPDKDDFLARGAEQITGIVTTVTTGLTIFLALVAGVSLLVGGIGIMNIMLVSVTERTREVGLRKAVGARKFDILLQFLLEAVALTVSGGTVGILGGTLLGWVLARIADRFLGHFTFVLSLSAIVLAVAMAVSVGLVFGLYPARRASNLSPMEALRYE